MNIEIIAVQDRPEIVEQAAVYLSAAWPGVHPKVYEDSVAHSMEKGGLPVWYLLYVDGEVIGCAGLTTNDFVSRQDLIPWMVALYISESHRKQGLSGLLIRRCKEDAAQMGYRELYLTTDHRDYYEKFGFSFYAVGYAPDGGEERIYKANLTGSGQ